MSPRGLIDFAHESKLAGVQLHIESGGPRGLVHQSASQLRALARHARERKIDIHLEASDTSQQTVDRVVRIARTMGLHHIRLYVRRAGKVEKVLQEAGSDLHYAASLAKRHDLHFTVENHEALTSRELIGLTKGVNSPRVRLLFDFGNMVNTGESPLKALATLAPYIAEAHMKDIVMTKRGGIKGPLGVKSGTGSLNQIRMLHDLLMLGRDTAQVQVIGLQEVTGYFAPMVRTSGDKTRVLPKRDQSSTPVDGLTPAQLDRTLRLEMQHARDIVQVARGNLKTLRDLASEALIR